MANLKTGSSGSEVKKLQEALVAAGYDVGKTGADGIFGANTAAAVKQYQKDNGLAVDGIAGKNTLGSLYSTTTKTDTSTGKATSTGTGKVTGTGTGNATGSGTGKATGTGANKTTTNTNTTKDNTKKDNTNKDTANKDVPATNTTTATPQESFTYPSFSYDPYSQSDSVVQANTLLQQHSANKPGAYQSQWEATIQNYLNQIQNRKDFSYDVNSDALYQQYRDSYIQQGQMAMMDTMGQAAAMTGGYGNSYAQSVGQQVYNQQLNQLNDIVPELYQMAYDRYNQEGQDLYNQYSLAMDQENMAYGRYQDQVNAWQSELDRLQNNYNAEREYDYSKYEADRALAYDAYTSDRTMAYNNYLDAYNKERDAVADAQWQATFDESQRQYDQTLAENQRQFNETMAVKEATSSGSGGGGGGGSSSWDNGDLSKDKVKKIQEALGVTADGKWGSKSSKAAGGLTAEEAWEAYQKGTLGKAKEEPTATTAVMSDSAKKFMSTLPYAPAGSNIDTWKGVVRDRMMAQVDSGALTDEDAIAIINKLGL